MNSFETDLIRAIKSKGFWMSLILELIVLFTAGYQSDLFRMCIPVLCTFPYTTAWLKEYQSGFLKAALPRTSRNGYIWGKFFSCGISGGGVEVLGVWLWSFFVADGTDTAWYPVLLFLSGFFWASLAAVLAAWVNSRYLAYGSSFVMYYLLVILHQRYFKQLYCLDPYEWIQPTHTWLMGVWGVGGLVVGLIGMMGISYYGILRRCMERV